MCADEKSPIWLSFCRSRTTGRGGRRNAEETPSRTGGFPFRPRDTTTRPTCATGARLWLRVVEFASATGQTGIWGGVKFEQGRIVAA